MVAPRIIQDQQWGTHYKFEWRMDHWIHGEPRTCYELCQQNFWPFILVFLLPGTQASEASLSGFGGLSH